MKEVGDSKGQCGCCKKWAGDGTRRSKDYSVALSVVIVYFFHEKMNKLRKNISCFSFECLVILIKVGKFLVFKRLFFMNSFVFLTAGFRVHFFLSAKSFIICPSFISQSFFPFSYSCDFKKEIPLLSFY